MLKYVQLAVLYLMLLPQVSMAHTVLVDICPGIGVQQRAGSYSPGGIILTTFDKTGIWVYNVDTNARYPLPETYPCGSNCRLSRDARWITYLNSDNYTYSVMRLDGTQRRALVDYAADVEWWSEDTLLVWTPGHRAYLQTISSGEREELDVRGTIAVQPGGRWGLVVERMDDKFVRSLANLSLRDLPGIAPQQLMLSEDVPYFNAAAWSPEGTWLAFVAPGVFDPQAAVTGGEVFGVRPGDEQPTQWTDLNSIYGAVRVNGLAVNELSWSPDGSKLAFWVIELLGTDPERNTGNAVIHTLNVDTGELHRYCAYSTTEHTPNPPRLVWSPDGAHLAFGGNIPADDKGYLLLVLDISTGVFTELSNGIFPALGTSDVIAWGFGPR